MIETEIQVSYDGDTALILEDMSFTGKSQADILRSTGQYGVLPTDTDEQAMAKLNAAAAAYADRAEAARDIAQAAVDNLSYYIEQPLSWTSGFFTRVTTLALTANASFATVRFAVSGGERIRFSATLTGSPTALAGIVQINGTGAVISSHFPPVEGVTTAFENETLTLDSACRELALNTLVADLATSKFEIFGTEEGHGQDIVDRLAAAELEIEDMRDAVAATASGVFPLSGEIIVPERSLLPNGFSDTGDRVKIGDMRAVIAANWNPALALSGANWAGWTLDAGTVWQNTTGTTAAGDGDLVLRVDDVSGNGHHLIQTDSAKAPTLRISGNRRWLEFGPGKWMAVGYSLNGAASAVAVAGFDHIDDDGYVYAARSSSSMFGAHMRGNNADFRWLSRVVSPATNVQAIAPDPYVGLASVISQVFNGTTMVGRRNGEQVATVAASGTIGHTTGYIYVGVQGNATTVAPSAPADAGAEPWTWNFYGLVISTDAAHRSDGVLLPLETWMRGKVLDNRANVLNVVLAGGQSNADGRPSASGAATELPNGMAQNVRGWNGAELMPIYNTDHSGPLANGTSFSGTIAAAGNFSFIDIAAAQLAQTVDNLVMCRVTMGDTALDPDDTANGSWNADYDSIPSGRVRLLFELEQKFAALQVYATRQGMTLNVLGLLWHQGESDKNAPADAAYQARMEALIDKVREFTGRDDLPVFMGTVPETSSSYNATIKTAQLTIAAADANIEIYDFDAEGGATYTDGVHFDAATQIAFGQWAATTLTAA